MPRYSEAVGSEDNTMQDGDDGEQPTSREALEFVARFIASLAEELAARARRIGLDTLSYILEMARLEADQIAKDYFATGATNRMLGPVSIAP